jgi:hypothetical protein
MTKIRIGQAPAPPTRAQFQERFNLRFYDPAFDGERVAIAPRMFIAARHTYKITRANAWVCTPQMLHATLLSMKSQNPILLRRLSFGQRTTKPLR